MTKAASPKSLRILAIHRYFWPDTPPYATMLRSIVTRWAQEGHEVEVLSTQPSYKPNVEVGKQATEEILDGVKISRIDLPQDRNRPFVGFINLIRFSWAIVAYAIRSRPYDIIMCSTSPPVFAGLASQLAARLVGARFVYHCMDLHPEIGRISGEFSNPVIFNLLKLLDMYTCRSAARVIVLSDDMKSSLIERGGRSPRVEVINNFEIFSSEDAVAEDLPTELRKESSKFRVLFAGNIGRFQGLETAVEAMRMLSDRDDIELVFMGDGKAVAGLKSLAGSLVGTKIKFFPHQPFSIAKRIMMTADVGLVSLTRDIIRYAFPSKTMSNLCAGLPLIVVVERDSELARFVTRENIGVVTPIGDVFGLASAISAMADDSVGTRQKAALAKEVGGHHFAASVVLNRWSRLPAEVVRS